MALSDILLKLRSASSLVKSILIIFVLGLVLVVSLIIKNQKSFDSSSKAAESVNQVAIDGSSYCQNPDPTIDKYIAPNGTNNSTCDLDHPCQTAEYAVSKAAVEQARHRVFARGGTYQSKVLFDTVAGTASLPIIFCGKYNGEQAIYQESSPSPVGSGQAMIMTIEPYYVISDFIVTGNSTNRANSSGHGWVGILLQARTEDGQNDHGHHAVVINNKVSNFWHSGISFAGTDQGNYGQAINNEIYNNNLENSPKDQLSSGWGSGLGSFYASNLQLIQNHVHNNFGEGIGINNSTNVLISQNTVHDNYSVQIYVDSSHFTTVERNFSFSMFDSSMYRCNSGCSCQPGPALALSGETNTVGDNIIRNNILTNTATNLNFFNGGYAPYMTNTKIYHNTIYNSTDSCRSNISISNFGGNGNEIRDNIIAQPSGNSQHLISSTSVGTYLFSNNDWNGGSGSHVSGAGDILSNPDLTSPQLVAGTNQPENYQLQSNSPVINVGLCLPAVVNDFWSITRPQQTNCDIGAYEFTTSPPPNPTVTVYASPNPSPQLTSTVIPTPTTPQDNIPPTVSFSYPVNGSNIPRNTTITLNATALDNVAVTRVEFRVNNTLQCTDFASPYTCNWRVPSKRHVTYTLKATAYDAANNSAVSAITVTSQ